jgi:Holliday junction resolvase RusA-like endonuclease
MSERHLVTIEVNARPATFVTAHEKPWKEAVRAAVTDTGVLPHDTRFAVRILFRLAASRTTNELWDLDNLIKPTLDAMKGVFGLRAWNGRPQAADDRVDRLEAVKRWPGDGEAPGATIDVWIIDQDRWQVNLR